MRVPIYADHNSTTPLLSEAYEAMQPFLTENYGNPSSRNSSLGRKASLAVETAREQIASFVDAKPEQVVFVSGGTESCFQALLGATLHATSSQKQTHFILSAVEHSAVHEAAITSMRLSGAQQTIVSVNRSGELLTETLNSAFFDSLEKDVVPFLSLMAANNETGVCYDLSQISDRILSRISVLHSDVTQIIGKSHFSFDTSPLHLASFSAHKFGAPKGIGALLVKEDAKWLPPMLGGGQESARRGGTLAVANIVGFGRAAAFHKNRMSCNSTHFLARDHFERIVSSELDGIEFVGRTLKRLPNTSYLICDSIDAQSLLKDLDEKGITVSKGSACSGAGEKTQSHVLQAMGFSERETRSAIRVSLGTETTEEEVAILARELILSIRKQRTDNTNEMKQLLSD